jgi:hypothetical protein
MRGRCRWNRTVWLVHIVASRPTLPAVSAFSVEQIQRGIDAKGLPETEMHDMTFIFVEHE